MDGPFLGSGPRQRHVDPVKRAARLVRPCFTGSSIVARLVLALEVEEVYLIARRLLQGSLL